MRQFMFILLCFSRLSLAMNADDASENLVEQPQLSSNLSGFVLDKAAQQLADIQTQKLVAELQQPEFIAYGTVLNPEPLLQLRQQYLQAQALQNSAQAKFTESHFNLARTENLHLHEIVSTRRLQEQQAQWQADKSHLSASSQQQENILTASRLQWGEILTDWFVAAQNKNAEQIINQSAQLIQITIPVHNLPQKPILHIVIDEYGQRDQAMSAEFISAAPGVDPLSQGKRFFYRASTRVLPFGSRITAWLNASQQAKTGVRIPKSALIWHLGMPCVYVKTSAEYFSRRVLHEYSAMGQSYFVSDGLQPGENIVISGAQILLSQELKALIPKEDDD